MDDGALYDRWLETRDGDAFAELARRHSPVVYDLTCRVLGDRSGAEDVLQEALLSLAVERTRKPVEVGVVAWLARFAICRARNRRASERSRARRQLVVGKERPEEEMPDDRLERSDELENALAGCDPEARALLAMRFLHGWEYDRIASALSIREGAVRVRVHRALEAVRARMNERREARVAPALAALPLGALPAGRLDTLIGTAVEIAKVRLGAPPNGVEQATAASHSFRVAATLTGAALVFVAALGTTAVTDFGDPATPAPRDVATADAGGAAYAAALATAAASPPASSREPFRVGPRSADWDFGLLRDPARLETSDPPAPHVANPRPAPADAPQAAAPAPAARAAQAPRANDPPDASRPIQRDACAANGDPASSDGERAGASGAIAVRADTGPRASEEEAAAPVDAGPTASSGSAARGAAPSADFQALPEETKALVAEAEDLVRDVLAAVGGDTSDSRALREGLRTVRRHYGRLRRDLGDSTPARRMSKAVRERRAATVRQVLSLLTQVVLADGRVAGDLRWPVGADVSAALAEVIRVLGTQDGASAGDLPQGALPSGAVPTGHAE